MFNLVEPDEFTPEEIEVIDALIDIAEEEEGKKMANLVEPDDFSSEEIDIRRTYRCSVNNCQANYARLVWNPKNVI